MYNDLIMADLQELYGQVEQVMALNTPLMEAACKFVDGLIAKKDFGAAACASKFLVLRAPDAQKAELLKAGITGLARAGETAAAERLALWGINSARYIERAEFLKAGIVALRQADREGAADKLADYGFKYFGKDQEAELLQAGVAGFAQTGGTIAAEAFAHKGFVDAPKEQKAEILKAGVAGFAQAGWEGAAVDYARWCVSMAPGAMDELAVVGIASLAQAGYRKAAEEYARWCGADANETVKKALAEALGEEKTPEGKLGKALEKAGASFETQEGLGKA